MVGNVGHHASELLRIYSHTHVIKLENDMNVSINVPA